MVICREGWAPYHGALQNPQPGSGMQIPELTGTWVDHPDNEYRGMYDPPTRCPKFASDFNCMKPYAPVRKNDTLFSEEYRKVRTSPKPDKYLAV